MNYSMKDHQLARLRELLSCQKVALLAKQGGGNSLVFCVEADGQKWAVKSYPPYAPSQRDRLSAELNTYRFLNQCSVPAVPSVKTYCEKERWLVMSWIDGVIPHRYSDQDIEQAIQFIAAIAKLNAVPEAKALPQAAEACLSLNIILEQIEKRYQRLQDEASDEEELMFFLHKHFQPAYQAFKNEALKGYAARNISPDALLAADKQSLIPADFGFHNAIRDHNERLHFFDFDYFGWDDPVKLLADILWHPKMKLQETQKKRFIQGLANIYAHDDLFLYRFSYTAPLFGLRWVLILLNEFIPAFWQNRQHAKAYTNQAEAKEIQLKRANELLLTVQNNRIFL